MKLVDSQSPELRELRPAAKVEGFPYLPLTPLTPPSVDFSKPVLLHLDFTTTYETYTFPHSINFGYGPYYYYFDSTNDLGAFVVSAGQNFCWINPVTLASSPYDNGISTVASMSFFPEWLLLEGWDPLNVLTTAPIFSLELPWDSLLTLDSSKLASGSTATEWIPDFRYDSFSEYCEVSHL